MKTCFYLFLAIFLSCSSKKTVTGKQEQMSYMDKTLTFGSGGGFTGLFSGYKIEGNGNVSSWSKKINMPNEESYLYKASEDSIRMLFEKIDATGFRKIRYSDPGNFSYFISLKEPDTVFTVTWSNNSLPEEVMQLNELLQTFIPQTDKR